MILISVFKSSCYQLLMCLFYCRLPFESEQWDLHLHSLFPSFLMVAMAKMAANQRQFHVDIYVNLILVYNATWSETFSSRLKNIETGEIWKICGQLDVWCKVRLGYANPNCALHFHMLGCWDRSDICLFHR